MKLLVVFLKPSKLDLYASLVNYLKPFDDVPMLRCVRQLPCPDGKQDLSTQEWLYQDLRVKWATLQMVEDYMTMLQDQNSTADHLLRLGNVPTFSDGQICLGQL